MADPGASKGLLSAKHPPSMSGTGFRWLIIDKPSKATKPVVVPQYYEGSLSDRDLERLSIYHRGDPENAQDLVAKATKDQLLRFNQYKRYYFDEHWKPRTPNALLDDEWFISDPEVLPEDDPAYLCEMCRYLNLQVLFTQRGVPGNDVPSMPTEIRISGLSKIMQKDGNICAFCGLLRRKIIDERGNRMADSDFKSNQFCIKVIDEGPEYALRLEIEVEFQDQSIERFVVQRIDMMSQQPLAGRFVRQDRADMERLRQWLQICESTHQSTEKSPDSDLESLRVIDTKELRVCKVATPLRYACLSYVWGRGSQTQLTTTTRDSLEAPNGLRASSLPQTIKDAIEVSKEAGLRYLWVDALCILQDDSEDKGEILPKMGLIYGGATMTIFASAHADPFQGLPGMGTTYRSITQDVAKVQGMTLAVCLCDPRRPVPDIENSVWNSRAWTFQEQALSTRSIHFTRSQMVFKCIHCAVMFEESAPILDPRFTHSSVDDLQLGDLFHLIRRHPSMSQYPIRGFSARGAEKTSICDADIDVEAALRGESDLFERHEYMFDIDVGVPHSFRDVVSNTDKWTLWDMYRYAVEDYTKRKLTYESDAVKAFAGLEHFIGRRINTQFWFGLPSFSLERALLWYAREPLDLRRQNSVALFPSWSWASWRGQVSYRGRGWKNAQVWDPLPVIRWYSEEATGEKVVLKELDIFSLRFLDSQGEDGWVVKRDTDQNRHIYSHAAYPGVKFTYPVNLPGQNIGDRRISEGTLSFCAHVVPIVPCDMEKSDFKMKLEDRFLQLGINDENRSANHRPVWKRIIYHQGYRAGFLILNHWPISMGGDVLKWHLAAITRGSYPHISSPSPASDFYWSIDPRKLQAELLKDEWKLGLSRVDIRPPQENVEPSAKRPTEDGDPHWDTGRFHDVAVFDVYDVLLLCTAYGQSMRIGAGKISCCAFAAAQPTEMNIMLN